MLRNDEKNEIIQKIESGRLKQSMKTNREHVRNINQVLEKKKHSNSCPKCGEKMILRESKKGKNIGNKFWGCSKYPKCRGVMSVTG